MKIDMQFLEDRSFVYKLYVRLYGDNSGYDRYCNPYFEHEGSDIIICFEKGHPLYEKEEKIFGPKPRMYRLPDKENKDVRGHKVGGLVEDANDMMEYAEDRLKEANREALRMVEGE